MTAFTNIFTSANPSRRIALAFLVALLLIAVGFALSLYSYHQYSRASERVSNTHRVINQLEDVLSDLKDVETGTRGYLIGGDSLYLEPYLKAIDRVPGELAQIRQLMGDNPAQVVRADTLANQAMAKIMSAQRQIANRSDAKVLTALLLLGKMRMDAIRRTVAHMIAEEEKLMTVRNAKAKDTFRQTIIVIFLLSLLTFLTLITTYNQLDAELSRRQKTEDQLRGYEEELQARIRQLTTSNDELERFAFVASHDLQEPLRKIQSFAGLISEKNKETFDPESSLFMTKIVNSADRMSRMIKDLLNFSRVSSEPEGFQTVRLNDIISQVLDDMELQVKGLNAHIQVDRLPMLPVNPIQMEQVFANLIGNALKYRKQGQQPHIQIQAEAVDGDAFPGLTPKRQYYKISVSDNGIGFDEKYAENIFGLFQRLHAKTAYEGTGIGLAVCKRVVLAHQGYIAAHSVMGEGATFDVVLPEKQSFLEYERSTNRPTDAYSVGG